MTLLLLWSATARAEDPPKKFEGEIRTLELDTAGGTAGAPEGMVYIAPPGAKSEMFAGDFGDGTRGLRLTVLEASDSLACTSSIPLGGTLMVKARYRVPRMVAGAAGWMGMNFELRARDAAGGLISPPGSMYVLIANLREAGDWQDVQNRVAVPSGATSGELCFRFVHSTGAVEVDRMQIVAPRSADAAMTMPTELPPPSVPTSPPHTPPASAPAPVASVPTPSPVTAASTAPAVGISTSAVGAAPPVAATVTPTAAGPLAWAFAAETVGNSVGCGAWFPVTGPLNVHGALRITDINASAPDWSGIALEAYAQDARGHALPAGGPPYSPVYTVTSLADGPEFRLRYTPPRTAARARLCVRFLGSAGTAEIDAAAR